MARHTGAVKLSLSFQGSLASQSSQSLNAGPVIWGGTANKPANSRID